MTFNIFRGWEHLNWGVNPPMCTGSTVGSLDVSVHGPAHVNSLAIGALVYS